MKKHVLSKIIVITLIFVSCIGCSKKQFSQSDETETKKETVTDADFVDYTVGLSKKIKSIEPGVQFWSSQKLQLMLCSGCNNKNYSVDEQGVVIIDNKKENKSFIIPKNCPGILDKVEKGIYWIQFDPEDSRLVPFKKVGDDNNDVFQLAVQSSNMNKVVLSDGKTYSKSSDPYLKISVKSLEGLKNKSKTAAGVIIGGDE